MSAFNILLKKNCTKLMSSYVKNFGLCPSEGTPPDHCHSDPAVLWRENAEGIPSGESMAMTHLQSTKLPCRGCFFRLRRDQLDIYGCFLHENYF